MKKPKKSPTDAKLIVDERLIKLKEYIDIEQKQLLNYRFYGPKDPLRKKYENRMLRLKQLKMLIERGSSFAFLCEQYELSKERCSKFQKKLTLLTLLTKKEQEETALLYRTIIKRSKDQMEALKPILRFV
jgi:hypothetical protein